MSSCDPNPPIFLLTGGQCGGSGSCVLSNVSNRLLCRCNAGYSGASDFFDTRVEFNNGTWLSLSCGSSVVGSSIVWAIFIVFGLLRCKGMIPVFVHVWKKHFADEGKMAKGLCRNFAVTTIAVDLFITTSLFFIVGICKLLGMTLGTDVLPTVSLSLTVLFFNLVNFWLTEREFSIIVKANLDGHRGKRTKNLRTRLKLISIVCYFLTVIIPSWWALSLDRSIGPIANYEYLVIVLRNSGTMIWALMELTSVWIVRRYLRNLLGSSMYENCPAIPVLKHLDQEFVFLFRYFLLMGCVYSTFLIPYLYQFQTYSIAIVVGLGALRHSAKAFEAEPRKTPNVVSKESSSPQAITSAEDIKSGAKSGS